MPHHPLFDHPMLAPVLESEEYLSTVPVPAENTIATDPRDAAIVALKLEVERLRDMGIRAELHAASCQRVADEAHAEVKTLERLLGRKVRGR